MRTLWHGAACTPAGHDRVSDCILVENDLSNGATAQNSSLRYTDTYHYMKLGRYVKQSFISLKRTLIYYNPMPCVYPKVDGFQPLC